jgi:hypothetical protein
MKSCSSQLSRTHFPKHPDKFRDRNRSAAASSQKVVRFGIVGAEWGPMSYPAAGFAPELAWPRWQWPGQGMLGVPGIAYAPPKRRFYRCGERFTRHVDSGFNKRQHRSAGRLPAGAHLSQMAYAALRELAGFRDASYRFANCRIDQLAIFHG